MKLQKSTSSLATNRQIKRSRTSVRERPLTILLVLLLSLSAQSHIFWMPKNADLDQLRSPVDVLSRLNLQNDEILKDSGIDKKVLKVGLKYEEGRPIYVIMLEIQASEKMFYGAEYSSEQDAHGQGEW